MTKSAARNILDKISPTKISHLQIITSKKNPMAKEKIFKFQLTKYNNE